MRQCAATGPEAGFWLMMVLLNLDTTCLAVFDCAYLITPLFSTWEKGYFTFLFVDLFIRQL